MLSGGRDRIMHGLLGRLPATFACFPLPARSLQKVFAGSIPSNAGRRGRVPIFCFGQMYISYHHRIDGLLRFAVDDISTTNSSRLCMIDGKVKKPPLWMKPRPSMLLQLISLKTRRYLPTQEAINASHNSPAPS